MPFIKLLFPLIFVSCLNTNDIKNNSQKTITQETASIDTSQLERSLIQAGLVNIHTIEPGILVDLKYSDTDNFMQQDMYGALENAYMQPDVANKLKVAFALLQQKNNSLSLLIYDAVRPKSIQQIMWDALKMPVKEKTKFIANPKNGSLHNYAAAVDITLCDKNGIALDMGTAYDYIGELAYPRLEKKFLAEGKLTEKQIANRRLLRSVMLQSGFQMIETEWWHFNSCSREEAKRKYKLIE